MKNGGYIGLIILLVTVCIIAFFMVTEMQSYGLDKKNVSPQDSSVSNTLEVSNKTPIEKAQNAKSLLESLDRKNIGQ